MTATAEQLLPAWVREARDRADRIFAESLAADFAPRHGRVAAAVMATNRDPETVNARRDVCRALRSLRWSLPRIGRAVGRHHSSVLHLLRT